MVKQRLNKTWVSEWQAGYNLYMLFTTKMPGAKLRYNIVSFTDINKYEVQIEVFFYQLILNIVYKKI